MQDIETLIKEAKSLCEIEPTSAAAQNAAVRAYVVALTRGTPEQRADMDRVYASFNIKLAAAQAKVAAILYPLRIGHAAAVPSPESGTPVVGFRYANQFSDQDFARRLPTPEDKAPKGYAFICGPLDSEVTVIMKDVERWRVCFYGPPETSQVFSKGWFPIEKVSLLRSTFDSSSWRILRVWMKN